jgi:hypothetical protein
MITMDDPTPIHVPIAEIVAVAAVSPDREAMRHKRRGQWRCWSWEDIANETGTLARALRERGIDGSAIVAISGDYVPALVLFAIAAARAGAPVVSVPAGIARTALGDWLRNEPVGLGFLGLRDQLGTWRAALSETGRQSEIVVDFHLPWGHPAGAGLTAAADLLGDAARGREARRPSTEVLWIEEGTDWSDGLQFLLKALAQGMAVAFPESRMAAGRDRREVQPARFALSGAHRAAVTRDLMTRLPAGPSLAAALTRNALGAVRRGRVRWYQRWLLGRLRKPFGLANLRELVVVTPTDAVQEANEPDDLFTALGIPAGGSAPPGPAAGQRARSVLAVA